MVFVINLSIGLALRAPKLIARNVPVYPFGIVAALVLNEIAPKWFYTGGSDPIGFGILVWFGLFIFYSVASGTAFVLLRFAIGYETTLQNPIIAHTFYLKSKEEDPVEMLRDFVDLFQHASPSINEEGHSSWLKFELVPNKYAIAFTPKKEEGVEVNILSYQIQRDVICEADEEESEVVVSMIDSLYSTWKKQGYVDVWQTENSPEYSEELRDALLKTYTATIKIPFKIPSIQRVKHNITELLRRNKKEVVLIILTAIVSPVIVHFIIQYLS